MKSLWSSLLFGFLFHHFAQGIYLKTYEMDGDYEDLLNGIKLSSENAHQLAKNVSVEYETGGCAEPMFEPRNWRIKPPFPQVWHDKKLDYDQTVQTGKIAESYLVLKPNLYMGPLGFMINTKHFKKYFGTKHSLKEFKDCFYTRPSVFKHPFVELLTSYMRLAHDKHARKYCNGGYKMNHDAREIFFLYSEMSTEVRTAQRDISRLKMISDENFTLREQVEREVATRKQLEQQLRHELSENNKYGQLQIQLKQQTIKAKQDIDFYKAETERLDRESETEKAAYEDKWYALQTTKNFNVEQIGLLEGNVAEISKRLETLTKRLADLQNEKKIKDTKIKSLEASTKELSITMQKKQADANDVLQKSQDLQKQESELRTDVAAKEKEIAELQTERELLNAKILAEDANMKVILEKSREKEDLEGQICRLNIETAKLTEEEKQLTELKSEKQTKLEKLEKEKAIIDQKTIDLKKESIYCENRNKTFRETLNEHVAESIKLATDTEKFASDLVHVREEHLRASIALSTAKHAAESVNSSLKRIREEIDNNQADISKLQTQLDDQREKTSNLRTERENEQLEQFKIMNEQLNAKEEALKMKEKYYDDMRNLKDQLKIASSKHVDLSQEVQTLEKEVTELDRTRSSERRLMILIKADTDAIRMEIGKVSAGYEKKILEKVAALKLENRWNIPPFMIVILGIVTAVVLSCVLIIIFAPRSTAVIGGMGGEATDVQPQDSENYHYDYAAHEPVVVSAPVRPALAELGQSIRSIVGRGKPVSYI